MFKKILFFLIIILFNFEQYAFSDIEKYKNLDKLEFDIYRNDNLIGYHNLDFIRDNGNLIVKSKINFEIKKLGILFYSYNVIGAEYYTDNKFVKFESKTIQNKKNKFCNVILQDNEYFINGSSYKGTVPNSFILGTWWNHEITKKKSQISAISGRIIEQKVNFLPEDKIQFKNHDFIALHYKFLSTDSKLSKNKKLNTDVWYDKDTLIWIKASFNKQGKWEYRLKNMLISEK